MGVGAGCPRRFGSAGLVLDSVWPGTETALMKGVEHRLCAVGLWRRGLSGVAWLGVVLGVGWLTGYWWERTWRENGGGGAPQEEAEKAAGSAARLPLVPYRTPAWGVRGVELGDLRGIPAGVRRTAEAVLWLERATPEEIAQWWPELAVEKPLDHGLMDLVMVRWMELAPLAALNKVGGTAQEYRAWWAWGKVAPEEAVRQAKAFKSGHLWRVLQGAGEGDPVTAIRLVQENPAFDYPAVEYAIKAGLKNMGWRESLDYLYDAGTLRRWASYDAGRAFDWALEHQERIDPVTWTKLVEHLNVSDPAKLAGVLERLPSGETRQNLMLAQAGWMAVRDLSAALLLADGADSPVLRNRMLARIGAQLVTGAPERSLALFREVVEAGGEPSGLRVVRPDGESWSRSGTDEVETWMAALLRHDPAAVMEIVRSAGDARLEEPARSAWMAADYAGYTAAVSELHGEARDREIAAVMRHLASRLAARPGAGGYSEALAWAAEISDPAVRDRSSRELIEAWMGRDAQEAAAFLEDGGASEEQRGIYQELKGGGK